MSKRQLWTRNFIIITIINFFSFFAFYIFPIALPPYLNSFGVNDAVLGWIQGVMTIGLLLARPFAGLVLDRYGHRSVFVIALLGMALCTVLYKFFPIVAIILIIRFVHGVAWGFGNTSCSTVASDNIVKERFGEGIGFFSLASSIAMAIAPAIALSLNMSYNIYLACGFIGIAIILVFFIKPKDIVEEFKEKQKGFNLYAKESIPPAIIIFFIMITYGAVVSFVALYGTSKGISGIGLFFTVYAVSLIVTRPFFGKLIDRIGFSVGIYSSVLAVPIALLILSMSDSLIFFALSAVVYGIGIGSGQTSLQTMAIIRAPRERTGSANATFFTGFDAGIGVGAVIAGVIAS